MANEIKSVSLISYSINPSLTSSDNLVLTNKGYVDGLWGLSNWSSGSYAKDALVVHDGKIYKSNNANNATTPGASGSTWTRVTLANVFSSMGSTYTNGNGIDINSNTISVKLVSGSGVYSGLTATASGLSVDTSDGIKLDANGVAINLSENSGLKLEGTNGSKTLAVDTGTAEGKIPVLGTGGKLDTSVIPSFAVTDVFSTTTSGGRTSQSNAGPGDICIETVSGVSKAYILNSSDTGAYATANNWVELTLAGQYQPAGDYALSSTVTGIDGRVTTLEDAGYLNKTTADGYYQAKGNYQAAGNYALSSDLANYQKKLAAATSNGLTITADTNDSTATITMTAAGVASENNLGTIGTVQLVTYTSNSNNTFKGYWSTSTGTNPGSDAYAATPKGVAAYVASTVGSKATFGVTACNSSSNFTTPDYVNSAIASSIVNGVWTGGTSYVAGDVVFYNDKYYYCMDNVSGSTNPGSDTSHWRVLTGYTPMGYNHTLSMTSDSQLSQTITHRLGQQYVMVQVVDTSDNTAVLVDISYTSTSAIALNFAAAPTTNKTYKVLVRK